MPQLEEMAEYSETVKFGGSSDLITAAVMDVVPWGVFAFLQPLTRFVLQEISRPGIPDLRAELDDFLEDRGAIPSILVIALGKWCEIGGSETL